MGSCVKCLNNLRHFRWYFNILHDISMTSNNCLCKRRRKLNATLLPVIDLLLSSYATQFSVRWNHVLWTWVFISLSNRFWGILTILLASLGVQCVSFTVPLLMSILAAWPAHCHFSAVVRCVISFISVCFRISLFLIFWCWCLAFLISWIFVLP